MLEYFNDVQQYLTYISCILYYTLDISVKFIKSMVKQLVVIKSIKLKKYLSSNRLYMKQQPGFILLLLLRHLLKRVATNVQ